VIRALSGAIPFSHRDLTPVADYPEIPTLKSLGISRSTARRYLEYLLESTELMVDQNYGAIGRPERSYRKCR
jgi:two-component system CitB family response regulator